MTNEPGTTLQDIEAKAERKREVECCIIAIESQCIITHDKNEFLFLVGQLETIRKYIEEK